MTLDIWSGLPDDRHERKAANYTPPEPHAWKMVNPPEDTVDFYEHEPKYLPAATKLFTEAQLRSEVEKARREAIEEAAKVCDDYAADKWSLYKGRPPYNGTEQGRADPDTQGHSDGASNCADLIRALAAPTKDTP